MKICLHQLRTFTITDGGEFVTAIPDNPTDLEEECDLEVISGGELIFEGTISKVWENAVGIQVIQAVATSKPGSGMEYVRASRVLFGLREAKKVMTDWEWDWIVEGFKEI